MNAFQLFEMLERRCLFAAAPPTALGLSIDVVVTGGSKPLASSGEYIIRVASTGRSYMLVPVSKNIDFSSGTYSYSVPSGDTGRITAQNSEAGPVVVDFKFVTQTSGTATLTRKAGGSETGTFTLTGPNFASLAADVLNIAGTDDGDAISAVVSKHQYVVTRNNITQKFSTTGITRINILAGTGNDVVDASTLAAPIYVDAGAGNDSVSTGSGNDTLTGGAGKNTLAGNAGDDRINGSGAPDLLLGGAGADRIYGNGGNDTLDGGGGVDRLFGGDGDDRLIGGGSNDKLYGEAGNDTLIGGAGTDLLDGGAGSNKLYQDSGP